MCVCRVPGSSQSLRSRIRSHEIAKGKVIFFDAQVRCVKVAKGFYPLRQPPAPPPAPPLQKSICRKVSLAGQQRIAAGIYYNRVESSSSIRASEEAKTRSPQAARPPRTPPIRHHPPQRLMLWFYTFSNTFPYICTLYTHLIYTSRMDICYVCDFPPPKQNRIEMEGNRPKNTNPN